MNDKQLRILLNNYLNQLENALNEAQQELPSELIEKYKNILGWDRERVPAFQRLYEFRDNLYQDIKDLEKE